MRKITDELERKITNVPVRLKFVLMAQRNGMTFDDFIERMVELVKVAQDVKDPGKHRVNVGPLSDADAVPRVAPDQPYERKNAKTLKKEQKGA